MKIIIDGIRVLIVLSLILFSFATFSADSLTWHDFETGLEKSVSEKKPMIVDFYADWCSWCKVMDEKTFADAEIQKILKKNFVLVRIDVEKEQTIPYDGKEFSVREFQAYMQVTGLPTLAFFDKTGKPITLLPGFVEAERLKPILGYISSECYARKVSFDQYMKADEKCKK